MARQSEIDDRELNEFLDDYYRSHSSQNATYASSNYSNISTIENEGFEWTASQYGNASANGDNSEYYSQNSNRSQVTYTSIESQSSIPDSTQNTSTQSTQSNSSTYNSC